MLHALLLPSFPAGHMRAERPHQDYYLTRTLTRAKEHVAQQSRSSSAASSVPQPPQDGAPDIKPSSSSSSPLVPLEQLQSFIDLALDKRLGQPLYVKKTCKQCGKEFERQAFTCVQWSKAEPVCTACSPVQERFQRRLLLGKPCAKCQQHVPRDGFSKRQWESGAAAVCKACTLVRTAPVRCFFILGWRHSLSQLLYSIYT